MSHRSAAAALAVSRAARCGAVALSALLLAAATWHNARAETVSAIRVRLNPETVPSGPVSPTQLARLETLVGTKLTQTGITRTGALEFTLAEPFDSSLAKPRLRALRQDRSVLWAEAQLPSSRLTRATSRGGGAGHAYVDTGHKLMVRLAGDPSPDWTTLLPRFSALVGAPVVAERQIGKVWVLNLLQTVNTDKLANMASRLETDASVQYADPVLRRFAKLVPNDPYYPQQWALWDPIGGIDMETAWDLQPSARRQHDGRGHRHRHPVARRSRGSRAAGLRLHLAILARPRRRRTRSQPARRGRLER